MGSARGRKWQVLTGFQWSSLDVNGSYFDIDKGGLNVGVAHEAHEGGKTHTSTHHIGGESMPEAMRGRVRSQRSSE